MKIGRWTLTGGLFVGLMAGASMGEVVNLTPSLDTSIYSDDGTLSNGVGVYLFAGHTRIGTERRALLKFDLGGIPAGSTITAATLSLSVSLAPPLADPVTVSAHRVLGAWGEGTSDAGIPGGGGILAETGDATWTQRVFPGTAWTTPGGDLAPAPSSSAAAGDAGTTVTFASGLVSDVQAWHNNAGSNFGWALVSPPGSTNARRFDSRESETPALRPVLTVTYTPLQNVCPADLDDGSGTGTPDAGVDINDLLYFLFAFEAGSAGADLDNDGEPSVGTPDGGVDVNDLLFFLARFEGGC